MASLQQLRDLVGSYGQQYPWVIFVALIVLPGFGFPASILLVLAGVIWGSDWKSCGLALAAVALNICWTHATAAGPGRSVIIRLLGERWRRWENLPARDRLKVAGMLRLTPGIPLFVQNYVLGLLGVPLRHSLLVALPLTGLYVCGFVLTGGAVFQGRFGLALTGSCLLIAAALAVRLLRARFQARGTCPD